MYHVYLLKSLSHPHQIYVGYTSNLKQRLETHNSGNCISTADSLPWKLVTCLSFKDASKAKAFEKYLKSHAGRLFTKKRLL